MDMVLGRPKMIRVVWSICTLFFFISTAPMAVENEQFRVSADTLDFDHRNERAELKGSVKIDFGEFRIRADYVQIIYGNQPNHARWSVKGPVVFIWREVTLTTESVEILQTSEGLSMEGPLELTSTRHKFEIRKAFFDFEAQTLRLQGVDGRMPMHTVLPRK